MAMAEMEDVPLGERREDSQQPATFDDGSWCHNLSDGNDFVN